jgi:DeoR/GlpR family transcriptional regulator of sugar metabolism
MRSDRQHIAEHLYGKREWTMERIAEALGVSTRTVSTDLGGFEVASKPARPKGGRPKGSRKPRKEKHTAAASVP